MKAARKYSLYKKIDGRWIRQSTIALKKESAIRFFQDALLTGGYELRPIPKEQPIETNGWPTGRNIAVARSNFHS